MTRKSMGGILAATALLAMSDMSSAMDIESSPNVPKPIQGKLVTCAVCGRGGGTLYNDGSKDRKVHKLCQDGAV